MAGDRKGGTDGAVLQRRIAVDDRHMKRVARRLAIIVDADKPLEDSEKQEAALAADVVSFQVVMDRMPLVVAALQDELREIEHESEQVDALVERTKSELESLRQEVVGVKQEMAHQEQYNGLARVIEAHQPRSVTQKEIDKAEQEIGALEGILAETAEATASEAKEFSLLLFAINELKRTRADVAAAVPAPKAKRRKSSGRG